MPDLLIRNLDPELHRAIESSARAHRRSLSEEAKLLLQRGFSGLTAQSDTPSRGLGSRLVLLGRSAGGIDDLLLPRDEIGRAPPFSV